MPTPPGNGFVSPFGDSAGATVEAPTVSRGTDFTQDSTGQARKVPVDNAKLFASRPQRSGPSNFAADSVPAGGRVTQADPSGTHETNATRARGQGTRKPFKLAGGAGPAGEVEGDGGEGGVGGLP